jgi:hypothetical protein
MRASIGTSAALACLLFACADSNKPATDPSQTQAQNASPTTSPPPTSQPSTPAAPVATTPPPTALPSATPASGGKATPLPPAAAAGADVIIAALAKNEAPGATPEGTAFGGQLTDGQTLEQPLNLLPGKCYTILAASVGGVQELDVMIQGQLPPLPPTTFAQDDTTGPNATLGGKAAGCWKNPSPLALPAKVVLRVTKGSGMAIAKVYVK